MNHFAVINIAKKELALDEDTYRAVLLRAAGTASLREMSERQLIAVIDEMKRLGFKIKKARVQLPASHKPYIRLIHALWRSCHRKGVIQDGTRTALRSFVKARSPQIDDPDFLTYEQADPIIKALKAMEARG